MSGNVRQFEWPRLLRPPFLAAAGILLAATLGLQWVIHSFEVFLTKKPIPLRRHLYLIPETFGHYTLDNQSPDLTPEVEAVLGAESYITREYHDTRLAKEDPGGLLRLHIAYFTGTPDMVIHVPEVCYVGGGAQGRQFDITKIRLRSPPVEETPGGTALTHDAHGDPVKVPAAEVPLRVFDFVPKGGTDQSTVAYFFTANGAFMGTTERVRTLVFDVRDKYAYWCKIEVLPVGITNREAALEAVADFLTYALPEVMVCLPDWDAVRAGTYPPPEDRDRS
jgi:hypothetical protein